MKKFLAALLAVAALFTAVPLSGISAYALQNDEFEYSTTSKGYIRIENCLDTSAQEITIPSEIDGTKVVELNSYSFASCNDLKKINLPATLESITGGTLRSCTNTEAINVESRNTVFYSDENGILYKYGSAGASNDTLLFCPPKITELKSVIPETVSTIYAYSFQYSSLKTINLPVSLTAFGDNAFEGSALETISMPDKIRTVPQNCFKNCSALTSVELNDVRYIKQYAFSGCTSLQNIILPSGLMSLEQSCFAFTAIESLTIPDSVTSIGNSAFTACTKLTSVDLPQKLYSLGSSCFSLCYSLNDVTIPKSVTQIGESVFLNCSSLNNIEILNSDIENLQDIFEGTALVNDASNYDENGILYCGNYLIRGKSDITELKIKDGDVRIAQKAFAKCSSLVTAIIPDNVISIASNAFIECKNLKSAKLPEGIESIPENLFWGCSSLDNISFPNSITEIKSGSLYGTGFNELVIPAGITKINQDAFRACTKLRSVEMLCSLDTLSSGMFQDCALLKTVKMATPPNCIGSYCFYGCSLLEEINIPEGVEEIGYYAFYKCNKESIILPKSVTDISEAFDGSVKTVYYAGTEEEWNAVKKYKYDPIINANVIYNYQPDTPTDNLTFGFSADGTLKISGSGEMGAYEDQSGFGWYGLRNEIKTVIFDEGVTSIAAAAFKGYENLSEVILCGTITDIGASAFENCGNLKFVTFKSSPAVGDNAFKNHNGKLLIIGENNNGKRFASNQNIKYLPVSYNSKKEALVFSKEITVYKDLGYYFITDFVRLHSQAKYLYFERLVFDGVLNEGDIDLSCVDDESNYLSFDGLYVSLVAVTENGKEQISFEQMLNLMKEGKYDAFKFVIAGHEETPLDRINERFENFFQDALKTVTRVINFFKRVFR